MSDVRYLLGVDGGGTKTTAWLAKLTLGVPGSLEIVARSTGGATNVNNLGWEPALANLRHVLGQVLSSDYRQIDVDVACVCAAGMGRPEPQERLSEWLQGLSLSTNVVVGSDTESLLVASGDLQTPADTDPTGICLVAGTGSMAWGADTEGQTWRSGGWGHRVGDEGSAFAIGKHALRLTLETHDGRAQEKALMHQVLAYLQLDSIDGLVDWCYHRTNYVQRVASLAPLMFACYDSSRVVRECVRAEANGLAQMVNAVASRLSFNREPFKLICTGGLLCQQRGYRELFESALVGCLVSPGEIQYVEQPVTGAVRLAHRRLLVKG